MTKGPRAGKSRPSRLITSYCTLVKPHEKLAATLVPDTEQYDLLMAEMERQTAATATELADQYGAGRTIKTMKQLKAIDDGILRDMSDGAYKAMFADHFTPAQKKMAREYRRKLKNRKTAQKTDYRRIKATANVVKMGTRLRDWVVAKGYLTKNDKLIENFDRACLPDPTDPSKLPPGEMPPARKKPAATPSTPTLDSWIS